MSLKRIIITVDDRDLDDLSDIAIDNVAKYLVTSLYPWTTVAKVVEKFPETCYCGHDRSKHMDDEGYPNTECIFENPDYPKDGEKQIFGHLFCQCEAFRPAEIIREVST